MTKCGSTYFYGCQYYRAYVGHTFKTLFSIGVIEQMLPSEFRYMSMVNLRWREGAGCLSEGILPVVLTVDIRESAWRCHSPM